MVVRQVFLLVLGCFCVGVCGEQLNPWRYGERYEMYMSLLNGTRIPSVYGEDNLGNILWGLPLQFRWQNETGRLPNTKGGLIEVTAWWGAMNYFLSVIPYIAAMESGLVPQITIESPTTFQDRFCVDYHSCDKQMMLKWQAFFELVKILQQKTAVTDDVVEQLQRVLWDAHIHSIHVAIPKFVDFSFLLSKPERHFGDNWAIFVDFLAGCLFPTAYDNVTAFQLMLPNRVLRPNDVPGHIPDMTVYMNRVLETLNLMATLQDDTNGQLLQLWDLAMESPQGREDGRYLLSHVIQDPCIALKGIWKLLQDAWHNRHFESIPSPTTFFPPNFCNQTVY